MGQHSNHRLKMTFQLIKPSWRVVAIDLYYLTDLFQDSQAYVLLKETLKHAKCNMVHVICNGYLSQAYILVDFIFGAKLTMCFLIIESLFSAFPNHPYTNPMSTSVT